MNTIKILFLILPLTVIPQTNEFIVDKISKEICENFNNYQDIKVITKSEAKNIITRVISENKTEWNNELDKIKNSRNNGQNVFDYLLNHRLQLTCKKFRFVDTLLDNYLVTKPSKRELYLKVKKFVILSELNTDINNLSLYFEKSIRNDNLINTLTLLQKELLKHKENSALYMMSSNYKNEGIIFVINIFDYKTGNENVLIKILFKNEKNKLIDKIMFKNKRELESEREIREKQSIDFIPPPPPPPPIEKKN